ncbi:MAG: hypothetical protein WKF47_04190 [Geodermatophilaceae bacterium]
MVVAEHRRALAGRLGQVARTGAQVRRRSQCGVVEVVRIRDAVAVPVGIREAQTTCQG